MSDLLSTACEAGRLVVADIVFTATHTVLTGLDDDNIALPNVIVSASDTGEEIPIGRGNHVIRLRFTKNSNAHDTTLAVHRADFGTLVDAVETDTIGATLAGKSADFYAYDPYRGIELGEEVTEDHFSSWIELEMLACRVDI